MNRRTLEAHLQSLFEGCLDREGMLALQHELRSSPEARDAYSDYLHLHNALQLRAEGIDMLHVVPMDRIVERRHRRSLRDAGLSAAAVLALAALVMALVIARTPPAALTFASSPGTVLAVSHLPEDGKIPKGQVLQPGSRLQLSRGTVELEFASGVRGIVRAPADLTLQREDLLQLANGTAWFEVPAKAIGFQVSTPDLILTDLGTEFGVISEDNFLDEVHVFKGKVELLNLSGLKEKETVVAGHARFAESAGRWKKIPLRRDLFLSGLPDKETRLSLVTVEEFSGNQFAYASDASGSDLLHGLVPKAAGWKLENDASPLELTDGIHGAGFQEVPGDMVQGAWTQVGATLEYDLGAGANGLGYDLTSIRSIADWNSAGFGNQAWTLEVRPVGGSYRILHTANYHPLIEQSLSGGGATKVTLSDESGVLAAGIEAIRFTAGHVANSVDNAFVWRELDVFGHPTVDPGGR